MKRMECSYVCEVLHFLLKERHGTPLVKLPVDLVDKDNEASLDLLCALFKHRKCNENIAYTVSSPRYLLMPCIGYKSLQKQKSFCGQTQPTRVWFKLP